MVPFGLGTLPALTLLPAVLQRLAARGRCQRRAIGALVLAAGLWSVAARSTLAEPSHAPAAHRH